MNYDNNVYLKSNIQTSSMDCTYKPINTKIYRIPCQSVSKIKIYIL